MKPKRNYRPGPMDDCQTPAYAVEPLFPYLHVGRIWEPAAGKGRLVTALSHAGYAVRGTDIHGFQGGVATDFLDEFSEKITFPAAISHGRGFDCIVTNPPYSLKAEFTARCIALGKPWALLMPVEWIGTAECQRLIGPIEFEWILLDKRVDFEMPRKGFAGRGAQFPVAWYTSGLGVGRPITFARLNKPKRSVH